MKWDYWICLYTSTHCVARGLRPSTIAAYKATLNQFRAYAESRFSIEPDQVAACHGLMYLEHLREERNNHASAVNRQVTILKNFYRAMVAMGHLDHSRNPFVAFPKIKAAACKLPVFLNDEEIERLLVQPSDKTVLGLRDRAILALLYGTGIRASECASLTEANVDLIEQTIQVTGKGGHQRQLPLNTTVVKALLNYRNVRGPLSPESAFFRSRNKRGISRNAIYERVRMHAREARIHKRVSPHKLRHTFATHLVKRGVPLVTIRDMLGHRMITSTQIYLHVTADDLREAADRHPIKELAPIVKDVLPFSRLPFQEQDCKRRFG
jgi:site-specific recombinase XerD